MKKLFKRLKCFLAGHRFSHYTVHTLRGFERANVVHYCPDCGYEYRATVYKVVERESLKDQEDAFRSGLESRAQNIYKTGYGEK